jgi:uncharacterized protein (TIGR02391 family)
MSLENALAQFRTLLASAIVLKGNFDVAEPVDTLHQNFQLLLKDLDYLEKLVPKEAFDGTDLHRHIGWINRRLGEGKPHLCHGDVDNICLIDIFAVQENYMKFIHYTDEYSNAPIDLLKKQLKSLRENADAEGWVYTTGRLLSKIFPSEPINLKKYRIVPGMHGFSEAEIMKFEQLMKGFIEELHLSGGKVAVTDRWELIHLNIRKVSKSRYETEHYGDAVEAAFKEINDIIKKAYKEISGKEEDGDKLMRNVFSANNPVFFLADTSTETGKSIQQGYMDIFAGAMKGIRNPKAHANLDVHPDEAWEIIVLASHLMRIWDKAKKIKPS